MGWPKNRPSYDGYTYARDFAFAVSSGDYAAASAALKYLNENNLLNKHIDKNGDLDNWPDQLKLGSKEYQSLYPSSKYSYTYDSHSGPNRTGYVYTDLYNRYSKLAEEEQAKNTKEAEERQNTLDSATRAASARQALAESSDRAASRAAGDSSQVMLTGRERGAKTMLTRGYQRRTLMGG